MGIKVVPLQYWTKAFLGGTIMLSTVLSSRILTPRRFQVAAKSALLIDSVSGHVLYEQNPYAICAPASITKLMTMRLACKALRDGRIHPTDKVPIDEQASADNPSYKGCSVMSLRAGDDVTVQELMLGMAIQSGCDAAMAMAQVLAGSAEAFVAAMNAEAQLLGMRDTRFVDPHGLSAANQTTAWDLAILARRHIVEDPMALEQYHGRLSFTYRSQIQHNTNLLVGLYLGADGLKTGFLDIAKVAQGDFDIAIQTRSSDELGRLATNVVRMTAQLKHSIEEERQAQRSRHELITSVSHDLRSPLTSILGYLELADQDRYRDEIELRHYVGIAYEKCRQLKRMIDQLFEFTRMSHGSLRLRPVAVEAGQLLEQLAEEFVPELSAAGMEYRLTIPPEPIAAMVDPDLLVRVLENLMTNAIRYGQAGKRVDLELAKDGGQIVLRVANYGEPIPEWELPHIFGSFYRVEKSRSTKTGGAGLGLAIAKNIVELHGGTIGAYNEPGRTVFEIRLPLQRQGGAAELKESLRSSASRS